MTTAETDGGIVPFPGVDIADLPTSAPVELENFANHPTTIGELRSDQTNEAKDWTVRDMLIFLLRNIDEGGDFAHATRGIVILAKVDEEGGTRAEKFIAGTKNSFETMGLVSNCLLSLQDRLA